jgi:glyoxylase-like metal-dependent hydrolase (beta-lactamase superfamily II)
MAHRFSVGRLDCTALNDGTYHYLAERFVANAPRDELDRALADHDLDPRSIPSPYTCLLVESAGQRVLLDTGGYGWDPGVGKLSGSLEAAGVPPEAIDVVVLTHGHPDHIGGTADEAGRLAYPNARHLMAEAEWRHWTSPDVLAGVPEGFRRCALRNLPPIASRVELTSGEVEVAPGVWLLPTPGHTPGHLAVVLVSDGQELIYISDAALHPMHLEHPEWHPTYDIDPVLAVASKRMLCERAVRNDSLVLAYHFDPFPSLGNLAHVRDGWAWVPVAGPADGNERAPGGGS